MSLNLFRRLDRYDRRIRQLERTEPPEGGGGGGGDHADSDHADAFSALGHAHAGIYAPVEHDSAHDDRFSQLAHTHAVHADSDHDDRFSQLAHAHSHDGGDHTDFTIDIFAPAVGPISMGGFPIKDLDGPIQPTDAAHKQYVDDLAFGGTIDWASVTGKPATFPPSEHDTAHDDRFVQLPGAWQTVTVFGSGWGAHASDQAPRYRLEGDIVRLDGSATRSSGTNTTIFTLPSGYRPSNIRRFWPAGGATASVRIAVQTSGTVDQTAGADFSRTSLEGCMFPIT